MKQIVTAVLLWVLVSCTQGPEVTFADGTKTQLDHWDGRWLVINYWAEWCAPCRDEIPELNDLHAQRAAHGLVVLGVNWDGLQDADLTGVIGRMGVEFPTLVEDPYLEYGYERAQQLPVTVLISPEREVADVLLGPQNAETILASIPAS